MDKQNWEGLWLQDGIREIWKSKTLDMRELAATIGSEKFRILMVRNNYYKPASKFPQFRFVIVKPDEQSAPTQENISSKESYYTKELIDNSDTDWY